MSENKELIVGIDEVGRGPLAGPVMAGAVILNPEDPIEGLRDSKKLTPKRREVLYLEITQRSLAWAIGRAEVEEIDRINILQASLLAMQRAAQGLTIQPTMALVDGNRCPELPCLSRAVIGGDQLEPAIMAASIIAKVTRDREMVEFDAQFPDYGFAQHKGYGTKQHLLALEEHGPCIIHRRSFRPVRKFIA